MKHSVRKKKKQVEEKVADRMLNTSMHRIIGALINVPKVASNNGTALSSSTTVHNARSSKPHHSRRERRNNPSSPISPSTSEESGNMLQAVTSSKIKNSPERRSAPPEETVTDAKDPISLPPATSWPTSPGSGSSAVLGLNRGTSIGTFCTALSEQSGHNNSLHAADDDNTPMVSKTENVVDHNDEDPMALDYAAEVAARSMFGSHADQPLTMDSRHHRGSLQGSLHGSLHGGQISGLRGSKLVSSVPGIDPSVFALRGLMSRRSFERYKKEMKNKVLKGASSNNLKGMDFKRVRRASMSMCDLRNDTFDNTAPHPAHLPSQHSSFEYVPSNRQQGRPQRRSTSVETSSGTAGVDYHFIESLVSSFKKEQDSNKLNSGEQQQQSRDTLFTTDEMVVLTNMMRRLSQDETPKTSPANLIQGDERSPTRLDPSPSGLTSLIHVGPKGDDLCDSSSSESEDEVEKFFTYPKPSEDSHKEKRREALNSYPDTNTSVEGGSKKKQQVVLNEVDFSSEAIDTPSKLGHPLPEVALTRDQSITSALSLPPLDRDVSMGTMNTGTNTSTKPLKLSFNRSETLSTCFSEEKRDLVDDMGERPDFNDRDFARTPSMPRIRRNTLSSESMGRRPSITDLHSRRRQSVAEDSSHTYTSVHSRNSVSHAPAYDDIQLKEDCGDLLAEGMEYLSMAMLVNIYGKLREMSLLGHVSVKLRDIDVNSHQYNSRKKELKRLELWSAADEAKGYLDTTRNAGFIVRTVMDEHELFEAEHARGAANGANQAFLAYDARYV